MLPPTPLFTGTCKTLSALPPFVCVAVIVWLVYIFVSLMDYQLLNLMNSVASFASACPSVPSSQPRHWLRIVIELIFNAWIYAWTSELIRPREYKEDPRDREDLLNFSVPHSYHLRAARSQAKQMFRISWAVTFVVSWSIPRWKSSFSQWLLHLVY